MDVVTDTGIPPAEGFSSRRRHWSRSCWSGSGSKGRPFAQGDVFRASRFSRGNHLFPTQVLITPTSVVQYTPQWIGRREETIHMAHIASVKIETGALLSDVLIETSGGSDPIACHGHRKSDAARIKTLIEQYQTDYYRTRHDPALSASATAADKPKSSMDDLIFSARRASATAAPKTAEPRHRYPVSHARAIAAARRPPAVSELAAGRELRRRLADADVRPAAARRRELRPRAGRLRGRGGGARSHPPRFRMDRPDNDAVAELLDQFLERRAAVSSEDQSPSVQRFREMIGRDEKMLIVFEWIRTAAKSDISVLILGPTGSGKEVVARMIHELSRRSVAKFQAVNCAALPDTLFESEIFGYEKGAFTGAHDRKPGRLELANEGTLFLDEIGDMSLIAQAKLLRVLEERRFERLGGHKSISVDFRLISATNRPLEQFVRDGRFREDLYYRVNAFAIRLPSLRERQVDIPVLAQRFLARYCAAQGMPLDSKAFRARRWICCSAISGRATSASSRAPYRAPLYRRPGRSIRASDIEFLHALDDRRHADRRSAAVARRDRTGAHRPRPRGGGLEQERGRAGARHQPRHPLSQDRRIPAGAGSAIRRRTTAS